MLTVCLLNLWAHEHPVPNNGSDKGGWGRNGGSAIHRGTTPQATVAANIFFIQPEDYHEFNSIPIPTPNVETIHV